MRLIRLCFAPLVVLVACGDDNKGASDAAPGHDSSHITDGALDAHPDGSPDARPDAAPGTGSRVWAIGDIGPTNNLVFAGGFDDGATLPFTPTSLPPLIVPGGTSQLASGTGYTSLVFDTNGQVTAFVADLTTAGTFDLYVAGADGSSPVLVVPGQLNVEIASVALSPDGTKIAYTSDSVLINGGYDLYVVAATANATPRQVSPLRPLTDMLDANLDVFSGVTWSADSKWVGFSGDLTTDGLSEAYIADTTTTDPAVVLLADTDITAPSVGVRGNLLFDAADNVFFRASGVGSTQFSLFKATPAGVRTDITSLAPLRTDTTVPDIGSFGLSPDASKIVFEADSPVLGAYDLYAVTFGNPTPTKMTNLTGPGLADLFAPIWFSPDGGQVAVVATYNGARREPFVIAVDGSGSHRLSAIDAACGACDASTLQWTADGATIYAEGDLILNNDTKLYRLDPTMTDQTPTLAVDVVTGNGDLVNVIVRSK